MRTLVDSLKRLYEAGSPAVTKAKLKQMVVDEKISTEEYLYITGEVYIF